jgi:hypothetical protein
MIPATILGTIADIIPNENRDNIMTMIIGIPPAIMLGSLTTTHPIIGHRMRSPPPTRIHGVTIAIGRMIHGGAALRMSHIRSMEQDTRTDIIILPTIRTATAMVDHPLGMDGEISVRHAVPHPPLSTRIMSHPMLTVELLLRRVEE